MTIAPDKITIEDLEITDVVQPSQRVALSANIYATDGAAPPPDFGTVYQNPDYCIASDLFGGVNLEVRVLLNGKVVERREYCWPMNERDKRIALDFYAPDSETTATYTLEVTGQRDGRLADSKTGTIDVTTGGGDSPCPQGFAPDGNGGCEPINEGGTVGGGSGGGADNIQAITQNAALLIGGVAAIRAIGLIEGE